MKKIMALAILGFFILGTAVLFAAEPEKKECPCKTILKVQGRGLVSFLSTPWEIVRTYQSEIKLHPKAWPVSYPPRLLYNVAIRGTSGINDILFKPLYWFVVSDPTPMTRRFDLPDYPWQKE